MGVHTPVFSTLYSWYEYQKSMLGFGLGLQDAATSSYPWTGCDHPAGPSRVLQRPAGQRLRLDGSSARLEQEVLAIGTPAIWWASILALVFCLAWWLLRERLAGRRRPGRRGRWLAAVVLVRLDDHRTEYYFYAIVFLPYLVMAITLCLGLIIGPAAAPAGRRATGAVVAGGVHAAHPRQLRVPVPGVRGPGAAIFIVVPPHVVPQLDLT